MSPRRILETCLCVADLEAAERFYRDVLGLTFVSRQEGRHVFLRLGDQMFLLFWAEASALADGDFPPHGTRGPGHVCFACQESEIDAWQERLAERGIAIEHVHTWPGGARSLYFRDPSGNSVELASPRIWGIADC